MKSGNELPWKNGGVYLITGGAGGLGLIFANEIAQKVKGAILILTGRSELSSGKEARIQELESLGATGLLQNQRMLVIKKPLNFLSERFQNQFLAA